MRICILLITILFLSACAPDSRPLVDYFSRLPMQDTLRFSIAGDEEPIQGDTIPNELFFGALPTEIQEGIAYAADSASSLVLARGRYRMEKRYEAWWIDIRDNWFQHQSLLLYDRSEKRITDRLTVAEWYGGESGQVLTGAWWLDTDGDGKMEIVQRQAAHAIKIEDEEVLESTDQYVSLWRWDGGRLVSLPVQDSLRWIKAFPLHDMWGD